jgi:tetratricopeptide (TPR) repeat protein
MKNLMMIAVFALAQLTSFADEVKFKEAMQKNIASLYAAETISDLQNAANNFNRIAGAEKTKWEPYYYSAFGYILMSTRENDPAKKDAFLDLAKASIDKASELKPDDSEIVALYGFEAMLRITINPQERGQQYSGIAIQYFKKALSLNPENPRAVALDARMQYGMAKFFGSTSPEACEHAKKALELLDKENPSDVLAPRWGKVLASDLLKECK